SFADWEAHGALGLAWLACQLLSYGKTGCGVFGILGENFIFPVKIDKKLMEITWKKNKDKIAEWEEQSQTVYFTSLRNRGLLNKETGSLTIFNLEKNDAGTYTLEYLPIDEKNAWMNCVKNLHNFFLFKKTRKRTVYLSGDFHFLCILGLCPLGIYAIYLRHRIGLEAKMSCLVLRPITLQRSSQLAHCKWNGGRDFFLYMITSAWYKDG
uniref:CD58 molecule n=1 Tax=Dromaius novaehollandiae TaxID=8790 RepID=A0A8C4JHP6_DRONO